MPVTLQRDLDRRNVAFDHDFIFKTHRLHFKSLITRYRGTNCVPAQNGVIVTSWQKSIYCFGSIPLEETFVATILVRWDGTVHGLSLDRRSHGGLGKLCDFTQLQQCINRIMRGKPFEDFVRIFPSPGLAQCLHLHEVLSAASSFYAHLRAQGKTSGSEEELLLIYPRKDGVYAVNERWALGRESKTTITLQHCAPPKTSITRLPRKLDSRLQIVCDGHTVLNEDLKTRDFPEVYGQLNRMLSKLNRVEKAHYGVKGRMRFTNVTAFAGLMLLTLAHESMHAFKAIRIGMMLSELQKGGARDACIAFTAIQNTYKPK